MASATKPLNLVDFRGGLNLRSNEFQLADNESPDMLNVEVDPVGGVATRKGWDRWNPVDIMAALDWDPRLSYAHELASGVDKIMVTNGDGTIWTSSDGTFTRLQFDSLNVLSDAGLHIADFAPWGDNVYMVRGYGYPSAKWGGSGTATTIPEIVSTANFVNDYTTPGTARFPNARFVSAHASRMWVADTEEAAVGYPYRVRWSHPNDPENWATQDFVDIKEGGGPITGLAAHEDHMLVFKASSVWAIYGYDTNSIQVVNVSRSVGAFNRQNIARSATAVYFTNWPGGVWKVDGGKVDEVSETLRPMLKSADFNEAALSNMWLGWLGERLWWSVPYWEDGAADDARSIFVFDPSVDSWTMFRSSSGQALGPFTQGGSAGGSHDLFGFCRCGPSVVRVEALDSAADTMSGVPVGFTSRYTTRWLHAGWPDLRKRWKRPTLIVSELSQEYTLSLSVFTNFSESDPARQFTATVSNNSGGVIYDDGVLYDAGAVYGVPPEGSQLKRVSGMGNASAIQVQIDGEVGKPWALSGIVFKYKPRRFR